MKLLVTTYHQAFLTPGGGESELVELAGGFRDLGVQADIYSHLSRPLNTYDVVLHFSVHGGGEAMLEAVKSANKPIVILPNFDFLSDDKSAYGIVKRHLDLADLIVLRTEVEKSICVENYNIEPDKIAVIKISVDPIYSRQTPPQIFKEAYDIGNFVLWVGKITEHKRQLETIEMLTGSDINLVFIGGCQDKELLQKCRSIASENMRFLGNMSPASEMLNAAYNECSAYLELGDDHPGHSAIEAYVSGCPLILKKGKWSQEYFGSDAVYLDDVDAQNLIGAIDKTVKNGRSSTGDRSINDFTRAVQIEQILTVLGGII
ncbi:MAG: glycosyltransferase [Lentilitoribacter sp.]